ncbi:periplasmic mercuric ion binding protein [mine drainage metagenome]|uniref:Periplasmic mercuric ion binding protein n=1 Tax=mine drainage metagenome TaxID=410659 RepID=T1ATD3_9ZZZZ
MKKLAAPIVLATAISAPAWAVTKTVTLSVPGMTCPVCPITIKKALSKVPGVERTEILFDKKEAVVTFNDAKTSTKALISATTDAGYLSAVKH